MGTFGTILYVIFIILYTIFAIATVCTFRTLAGGLFGSLCLITGGVAIYYIIPAVIVLLTGLVQAALGLLMVGAIIAVLCNL